MTAKPICCACTRNARTVDTPLVKVRVERFILWREGDWWKFVARCHNAVAWGQIGGEGIRDEDDIEALEVFRG